MKRSRLFLVLFLLFLLGGLVLLPQVRWPVYGWLRGEAFYQGMPTSYWREECQRWLPLPAGSAFSVDVSWVRQPSDFEKWLDQVLWLQGDQICPLVNGDPKAVPVLLALLQSNEGRERLMALDGLEKIGPSARAAVPLLLQQVQDSDVIDSWVWQALVSIDAETARKLEQRPWRRIIPIELELGQNEKPKE